MAWHEAEIIALVCYGLNTFTGQEWGYGDIPAKTFNPTNLDTDQWVAACVAGGITGIILVAKHHDGFCLWPSKYTDYSVKSSPWKGGRGDVLGDLAASCRKRGVKLGVYLSPWDRNHAEYARPAYVDYFFKQWREVMTQYGELFEIWFDGANGGTGYYGGARERRSIPPGYYRYPDLMALRDELQPDAVAFGANQPNSTRWVGNEAGVAAETNWCTQKPGGHRGTGAEGGALWMPAESDTPFRRGWYWHEREDPKTLEHLIQTYFRTVGRNSTLNFGIAPDTSGLIAEEDVQRLREFGDYVRALHQTDLARNRTATSPDVRGKDARFAASRVTDGNRDTYWATDDGVLQGQIEIDLGPTPATFDVVQLQEYIRLGQRVRAFRIEALTASGDWVAVAKGTTIGYKRLLRTPLTTTNRIRLRILDCRACPTINCVALFRSPVILRPPAITVRRDGTVVITAGPGSTVRYAVGTAAPDDAFREYREPFALPMGGTVAAYGLDPTTGRRTEMVRHTFGLAKTSWTITGCSFPNETDAPVARLIDGDERTMWHTHGPKRGRVPPPHWVTIDLGQTTAIGGFACMPRHDRCAVGLVDRYAFHVSDDGADWGDPIAVGEFPNVRNNPVRQVVLLPEPVDGRHVKFVATHAVEGNSCVAVCELDILAGDGP